MRSRSLSLVACAGFLLLLAMLAPSRVLADSITVTPDVLLAMVNEGKKGSITYTVANLGINVVTINQLFFTFSPPLTADFTDQPVKETLEGCKFGTKLNPAGQKGSTCTVIFKFTTALDEKENGDSGISSVDITVGTVGGAKETSVTSSIEVDDCRLNGKASCRAISPEPSGLLLLGTGALALVPVVRRKLRT